MGELIKIREISSKYDVSARTLRYYEDMGLLSSTRSSDYTYRLYDQEAVGRGHTGRHGSLCPDYI